MPVIGALASQTPPPQQSHRWPARNEGCSTTTRGCTNGVTFVTSSLVPLGPFHFLDLHFAQRPGTSSASQICPHASHFHAFTCITLMVPTVPHLRSNSTKRGPNRTTNPASCGFFQGFKGRGRVKLHFSIHRLFPGIYEAKSLASRGNWRVRAGVRYCLCGF
jgi:hypothetical protein